MLRFLVLLLACAALLADARFTALDDLNDAPPPPVDGYEDDSPPNRHDTPPLLMRHAPKAALDVQLSTRSTALANALDDNESTKGMSAVQRRIKAIEDKMKGKK